MITRRGMFGLGALAIAAPSGLVGSFLGSRRALAQGARPTVVELFTSQGCSSCPPADAFLGELARRDDVIALAYHVDYWDYIGWADPFGSAEATARQRSYGQAMRLRTIYTPQMVIDGRFDVVGSRTHQVESTLKVARGQVTDRVDIPVTLAPAGTGVLEARIAAADTDGEADVLLVAYDDKHETVVPRGENAGRTLTDFNVVRGYWPLGTWGGKDWSRRIELSAVPVSADKLVVLVQAKGHGPIWGAAEVMVAAS